jgi:hypothetical protein
MAGSRYAAEPIKASSVLSGELEVSDERGAVVVAVSFIMQPDPIVSAKVGATDDFKPHDNQKRVATNANNSANK